jgi:hypothetical protein
MCQPDRASEAFRFQGLLPSIRAILTSASSRPSCVLCDPSTQMLGLCTPYRMCVALALVLLFPGTALAERDATPAEAATVAFALQALGDTAIGDGAVNLPSGGRAKTGGFPWRFSPGAFPLALFHWRCAAVPGSAISRHTTIAPARSARSPDDDMAWRGKVWRLAIGSWIKTRRFRCRAGVNRLMILFMILLRCRVSRCAFFARLLRPLCCRCSAFRRIAMVVSQFVA